MKNDHEPVAQALNSILLVLDMIAAAALDSEDYAEVAAEEVALGQILSRTQLILSFIDAGQPDARQPPHLRVVK
jgi:hypothetical protein